jgi:hypothetical protein
VSPADLAFLDDDEFLNDTIMDYYAKCARGWRGGGALRRGLRRAVWA